MVLGYKGPSIEDRPLIFIITAVYELEAHLCFIAQGEAGVGGFFFILDELISYRITTILVHLI